MKLGIMRCMQTEDMCASLGDLKAIRKKGGVFAGIEEEIVLMGITSCGGCPGKRALMKAKLLVSQGADTIAFASCIAKGLPMGIPCPFHAKWREVIEKNLPNVRFLDYTH